VIAHAAPRRLTQVQPGLPRAILAGFLISEVHPFADGNGRVSRLVMNAELSAAGLTRIIIPTVARDDYVGALRLVTREGNADPLVRFLVDMQRWTASFAYADLSQLEDTMRGCSAFEENLRDYRLGWPEGSSRLAPERLEKLVASMQTKDSSDGVTALFHASPRELGEAAVAAARKPRTR